MQGDRAEGRHLLLVLEDLGKNERFFGGVASEGTETHVAMDEAGNQLDVVLDGALVGEEVSRVGRCLLLQQVFQAGTCKSNGAMVAIEAKLFEAQFLFYARLPGVQAMLEAGVVSGLAAATAACGGARHGIPDF